MPKSIEIEREVDPDHLRRLAESADDPAYARRLLAVAMVVEGQDRLDVARTSGVGASTLRLWIRQFNQFGITALRQAASPGRPARLTDAQQDEVARFVSGERFGLRLAHIAAHIQQRFGIVYNAVSVGRLLKKLGFTFENGQWRAGGSRADVRIHPPRRSPGQEQVNA